MGDGVQWLAEEWRGSALHVTFAREVSVEELAVRLGAEEGQPLSALTAREAAGMVLREGSFRVARLGRCGGWTFAVEAECSSRAWWGRPPLSEGGVEVLHLTPKLYDPPKECWYYRDGETVGHFALGERPVGMDFLVPALEAAGALPGGYGGTEVVSSEEESRRVLAALEGHFGIDLPREQVLQGRLPAAVTSKAVPEHLGD